MKLINSNTLITSFKKGDRIIRTKPVNKGYIIDNSFTSERESGPIELLYIGKDKIEYFYLNKRGKISKSTFFESELKIGKWLDGWKLYKE